MTSETDRAEVARAARELSYDDYLAALLAPRDRQPDLIALAALFGELARIPLHVNDPALGEIRLQWWRDALASETRSGHPVADAARSIGPRLPVPLSEIINPVLEAHAAELYAEPFVSSEAFDAYATAATHAAFAVRAALLAVPDTVVDPIVAKAACTLGLVRTCARLPFLFAKGRYPLPPGASATGSAPGAIAEPDVRGGVEGLIGEAATAWTELRPQLPRISPILRRVVLPVALAGPYLRAIGDARRDVLRDVQDPSPLEKSARLWLAARLGRF